MGKDKKEKNPADAFRKDQRKKELLKLKKDREVVKGVRDMLNDPRKIDEEITKAQKVSDENKLDKSLKDKIKELQRMRDVANTRQLVLAAQGKKSMEEVQSIIKPSIYQKNEGLWDDANAAKPAPGGHSQPRSASRISTEGLKPHVRSGDSSSVAQMPVPTSVMMPYHGSGTPLVYGMGPPGSVPPPPPGRPVMGGMAGIPLPPPRPSGITNMPAHVASGVHLGYPVPPPPPPRPGMAISGGIPVPPPPGPPPGYPYAQFPPGFVPHVPYGYNPMGVYPPGMPMQIPVQGAYVYPHQQPHHPGSQSRQQQQQQKDHRKPRPARGKVEEEVDPLDPAGQGYTERFGAVQLPKRGAAAAVHTNVSTVAPAPAPELPTAVAFPETASLHENNDIVHINDNSVQPEASTDSTEPEIPLPVPASFGPALSAEELMRRRHVIPAEPAVENHSVEDTSEEPAPGPSHAPPAYSYPTLSAEELLRRRYQLPADENENIVVPLDVNNNEDFVPARPPADFGQILSAEELLRRRYMVSDADYATNDDQEIIERHDLEESEEQQGPSAGPAMGSDAVNAEELLRRRYEIPDFEVQDVDSEDDDHEREYLSEDDVRSAGLPEPDFDLNETGRATEEEENPDEPSLELNLRNLYPARLPASFTQLPPTRAFAQPLMPTASVPGHKPAQKYSAVMNFNDYGDDDDDDDDDEEEVAQEVVAPPAPKIQPYSEPSAPVMMPARAPENFSVSSYYPEGVESSEIVSHAVKGPKIVKTDRALTAFVPNALKKKRLLTGGTGATPNFSSYRKASSAQGVQEVHGEEDIADGGEPPSKVARESSDYTAASLHAATSALFHPSSVAQVASTKSLSRVPVAPIAFVPATSSSVSISVSKAIPAAAPAEDDAFAQFFNEINQLPGI